MSNKIAFWPYNPMPLIFYDYVVLKLSTPYIWGCSLSHLQEIYDNHLTQEHLEIGVGTGYFLKNCRSITNKHNITLLDINPVPIKHTSRNLRSYKTRGCLANVMKKLPFRGDSFHSVGMNFVLHCLPEPGKESVFSNIRNVMSSNSVLFGSTVLASTVQDSLITQKLMSFYNATNAFHNTYDTTDRFISILKGLFSRVDVEVSGVILVFKAYT